jgi:hypothetical protein
VEMDLRSCLLKQEKYLHTRRCVGTGTAQIPNDKLAEPVFQYRDDRRGKASRAFDLGNQQKYIVKHFNKGCHYRACLGPEAEYEEGTIARQRGSALKRL